MFFVPSWMFQTVVLFPHPISDSVSYHSSNPPLCPTSNQTIMTNFVDFILGLSIFSSTFRFQFSSTPPLPSITSPPSHSSSFSSNTPSICSKYFVYFKINRESVNTIIFRVDPSQIFITSIAFITIPIQWGIYFDNILTIGLQDLL